ncbi:hypothetical protein GALL_520490 [mine drainage metagenome]|uniref:Uncharacterized protein n=1 Tax=mine drainage metagenome TaxID=410659 RepID=A0A1J5PFR1_9ZZZZ
MLGETARIGHDVPVRRACFRETVATAELHPDAAAVEKTKQGGAASLELTVEIRPRHVVDDDARMDRGNRIGITDEIGTCDMDRDMPAEWLHQRHDGAHRLGRRAAAEMSQEVEAYSANSRSIEARDLGSRGVRPQHGDAAITSTARCQRVEQRPKIETVPLAVDDDRALNAERVVKRPQSGFRRFLGRKAAIGRQRKAGEGSEDVAMRVAGKWRRTQLWRPGDGMGRRSNGLAVIHVVALNRIARSFRRRRRFRCR